MRFSSTLAVAAAAVANAQRPSDVPICDYYTKALLKENTAENQATLLTLLVNTVVIGNCKLTCRPNSIPLAYKMSSSRHHAQQERCARHSGAR